MSNAGEPIPRATYTIYEGGGSNRTSYSSMGGGGKGKEGRDTDSIPKVLARPVSFSFFENQRNCKSSSDVT